MLIGSTYSIFTTSEIDENSNVYKTGVLDITYTLTDDNSLKIEYNGISDKDTVANMTNHSYFNLAGHNSRNCNESNSLYKC